MINSISCAECGSDDLLDLGPCRRAANSSAWTDQERQLAQSLSQSHLIVCRNCGLGQRVPCLSDEQLRNMYPNLPVGRWDETGPRASWIITSKILEQLYSPQTVTNVLDIGAFDGGFLQTLPLTWNKFAVEPSTDAAERLKLAGVSVIANFLEQLPDNYSQRFDVITLFDVFEHLRSPEACLQIARRLLKPNGFLIISTGNIDHWTVRYLKGNHWYFSSHQHIRFASPKYIKHLAKILNLKVEQIHHHAHTIAPQKQRLSQAIDTAYYTLRQQGRLGISLSRAITWLPGMSKLQHRDLPGFNMALPDHLLAVLHDSSEPPSR